MAVLFWSGQATTPRLPDRTSGDRIILVDIFRSVDACAAASGLSRAACAEGGRAARAKHDRSGPKFGTRALCEARFGVGACDLGHAGSEAWATPRPAGFLHCAAGPRGCSKPTFAPVYRNAAGAEFIVAGEGYARRLSAYAGRFRISRLAIGQSDI
ncbi:DUF1190 domain-containing protein [Sphingopyxis sp.]|uniref:DUF1190 domain-containing protein n=1 Tax=Sphingopyxis sp. TaxID=1908224 RepID=UPI002D780C9F|nr:DUF1190 domain-containing protein [Sphingopyxis sp.]HET6523564.1 DUF1190 domain-containing protein [Sphingopyxis sp.]